MNNFKCGSCWFFSQVTHLQKNSFYLLVLQDVQADTSRSSLDTFDNSLLQTNEFHKQQNIISIGILAYLGNIKLCSKIKPYLRLYMNVLTLFICEANPWCRIEWKFSSRLPW